MKLSEEGQQRPVSVLYLKSAASANFIKMNSNNLKQGSATFTIEGATLSHLAGIKVIPEPNKTLSTYTVKTMQSIKSYT